ncbi:MAG: hypothetical protein FWC56_00545 [Phycisphaerae bacterium]|nr:hypothetical protein [Phycisphaerae bacterium]
MANASTVRRLITRYCVQVVLMLCFFGGLMTTSVWAARARIRPCGYPLVSLKNRVERNAAHGREFTRESHDDPTRSSTVTAWFYKHRLQKLAVFLLGNTGQIRNTYYLVGKWVVCVEKEQWKYNRPITSEQLVSAPLKKRKIKHEEYYLGKNKVWFRSQPKSKLVALSATRGKRIERQLTTECTQVARVLKKQNGVAVQPQPKAKLSRSKMKPSQSKSKATISPKQGSSQKASTKSATKAPRAVAKRFPT